MWRFDGIRFYSGFIFFLITLESIVLLSLSAAFILNPLQFVSNSFTLEVLKIADVITIIVVGTLAVVLFVYQWISKRFEQRYNHEYNHALEMWSVALFQDEATIHLPITPITMIALVNLLETMKGEGLYSLLKRLGIQSIQNYWLLHLKHSQTSEKINALSALGVIGDETAFSPVLEHFSHRRIEIQIAAAHTAARIFTNISVNQREHLVQQLGDALIETHFSYFLYEQVFSLLEDNAKLLIQYLLPHKELQIPLLRAVVISIGTSYLVDETDHLIPLIKHKDVGLRCDVLKTFAHLTFIPKAAFSEVLNAVFDENESVKLNALAALKSETLYHLRAPLWIALGDADWNIRLTTASVIMSHGVQGKKMLQTAAIRHPSPEARQLASQVLQSPEAFQHWKFGGGS